MDNLALILGGVLLAAAIAVVVYTVLSQLDEKATVRNSLRQLEGYEVENVRDADLLAPLSERALAPVLGGLTNLGRRFTPVGYVDNIRKKYISAGETSAEAVDRALAIRVILYALVLPWSWFALVSNPLGLDGLMYLLVWGVGIFVLVAGPDAMLNRRVAERQHELQTKLPDILDLLTISVEAGLGFEQALDRTINAVPGALSDEFARMLGEVRAGATRSDAMRALDQRCNVPEVRSFVLAILQADTFGVSIGRVLRAQAEEMRIKRRQLAQERAQKAPVKMLIPMVFCIFPALFVVVIGPAIVNIRKAFSD
jgi:tight adherence protein C